MTTSNDRVTPAMTAMGGAAFDLMAAGLKTARALFEQSVGTLPATLGTLGAPKAGKCGCGCCEIPETQCPPRCVCSMTLAAMTGQTVNATIRITNTASSAQTYTVSAQPFHSGGSSAALNFLPHPVTIAPGASADVIAFFTIPVTFVKGSSEAEVTIGNGNEEQCVCVVLDVGCDEQRSGLCAISQGGPRTRIRAHHWYDHFQCVELCEPLRPLPIPILPGPVKTNVTGNVDG